MSGVPWILVLNWNGRRRLPISLGALARLSGDHEVLVVDNGSTDGSSALVKEILPRAHLLENGANLGFAEGNNQGIRHALEAGASWVGIVNDDMSLDPAWLTALLDAASRHPRAGILGGLVLFRDRPDVVNSSGLAADRLFRIMDRDFGIPLARLPRRPESEVDAVTGGAMLIRRDVLETVGAFDRDLFAYCEDYDLCRRARAAGYEVVFTPAARSFHEFAGSQGAGHPTRTYLLARNHLVMLGRYAPRVQAWLELPAVAAFRLLWKAPSRRLRGDARGAAAEVRAVRDGLPRAVRELMRRGGSR